ncbi:MAG: hypothetical protein IJS50_01150, partial [Desulfovibrio sp.]|nr:hypothetical protein [Desulfovibrio sp.]
MGQKNHLTRRQILAGLTLACGGLAGLGGYASHENSLAKTPTPGPGFSAENIKETKPELMTYSTSSRRGDKVSLLGFGCMRYPVVAGENSPRSPKIDEAKAFALVDYA